MNVYTDIGEIKGIGPKSKQLLNKLGIYNIMDLMLYFPRDYENVSQKNSVSISDIGEKVILECKVKEILRDLRTKSNKVVSTVVFINGDSTIKGKWFNQPYIKNKFIIGENYVLKGKIDKYKNELLITNPIVLKKDDLVQGEDGLKIMPKYSLTENLNNNFFVKLVSQLLSSISIEENLPMYILEKYKLMNLGDALHNIHFPQNELLLAEALKRLKFHELFIYSMKVLMLRHYLNRSKKGIAFRISKELADLKERLPYSLTDAQSRVIREILLDQKKPTPMNRLVQGDVGSGKTIVAVIAMFNVVMNGYQTALMAPTEILARQHFEEVTKLLKDYNLNVKLLTGSSSLKEKEIIIRELESGETDIIIGTHAIIEDNIRFANLGMVVTDEQHRFGVGQRSKLLNKAKNIDMLVMTATPIPRTLALYMYGDLDVSMIDELPPGRQVITTMYTEKKNCHKVYSFALEELNKGRQVYIVCPLVEENEELDLLSVNNLYVDLKEKYFTNIEVEILHGKMAPKVKDEIMNKFKEGYVKVLVSTTVIEVGINVPNATLMIIENAERFGLAQLHQLRGRVGRGIHKSYCILVANIKSETVKRRMEIMKNSNDGFYIAEEDFRIRGGGQLIGYRQSGDEGLVIADAAEDFELLKLANAEAKKLLGSNDKENEIIKNEILKKIENFSKFICFN